MPRPVAAPTIPGPPTIVFAQRYTPTGQPAALGDTAYRSRAREWFAACCDCGHVWPYTSEEAARSLGAQPHRCVTARTDETIVAMRAEGATWAEIAAVVGMSPTRTATRGQALGCRINLLDHDARERLVRERRAAGVTWAAIAAELGIGESALHKWAGQKTPDLLSRSWRAA